MDFKEADNLWYELKPIEVIRFVYNDHVRITAGEHTGKNGSVISLVSVEPIVYIVELESGAGDVHVAESQFEIADTDE